MLSGPGGESWEEWIALVSSDIRWQLYGLFSGEVNNMVLNVIFVVTEFWSVIILIDVCKYFRGCLLFLPCILLIAFKIQQLCGWLYGLRYV